MPTCKTWHFVFSFFVKLVIPWLHHSCSGVHAFTQSQWSICILYIVSYIPPCSEAMHVVAGGWIPSTADATPWIRAHLGCVHLLYSITTQGHGDYSQWTTSYRVEHCHNEAECYTFPIMSANSDQNTRVTNILQRQTFGLSVTIYLESNYQGYALRWDIFGGMRSLNWVSNAPML